MEGMEGAGAGASLMGIVIYLVVYVAFGLIIGKVLGKAGKPVWAGLVPIYNLYLLLEISGKPAWWIVGMLIPCVNLYFAIMLSIALGERFGKSAGWSVVLLALFGFIGYPMLAFGSDSYSPPPKS
ncbi:MAG: signal peptidase I [Spirochaetales bacterium]|nr:signal peptidase I [Spirochaetales bacterium]